MPKKMLSIGVLLIGLAVIGAACSPSSTNDMGATLGTSEKKSTTSKTEVVTPEKEISEGELPQVEIIEEGETAVAPPTIGDDIIVPETEGEVVADEIPERLFNLVIKKSDIAPKTITVNTGDRVILNITAEDEEHQLVIKAYNIDHTITPGNSTVIELIADKPGEFKYYCSKHDESGSGQLIVQ